MLNIGFGGKPIVFLLNMDVNRENRPTNMRRSFLCNRALERSRAPNAVAQKEKRETHSSGAIDQRIGGSQ